MNYTIRLEWKQDHPVVETLTRDAFWDVYCPGCTEHLVVHKLRNSSVFLPELNFVALDGETIVGHAMATKTRIDTPERLSDEVLCFAPLSVRPDYQNRGLGGILIRHMEKEAVRLGYGALFLIGHPDYYQRFGFRSASEYNISMPDGSFMDELMVLELLPGGLAGMEGRFLVDPVFDVTEEEVDAFDKQFPFREKHVTDTQLK